MTDPLDESIFGRSDATEEGPLPTRRSTRAERPARPRRRGRKFLALLLTLAILGVGGYFAYGVLRPIYDSYTAPKDYAGEGTGSVTVVINPGDSGAKIAQTLAASDVVKTASAFEDALNTTKGDEIQPGTYTMRTQMKASAALSLLRSGSARNVAKVIIREGLWKSEVYKALSEATGTPLADYQAVEAALATNPALLGLPASAKGNPEGYFFPATYQFDKGTPAAAQLKKMVGLTTTKLAELGITDEKAARIMTVASIIEGEAAHSNDRAKVARVIENRLAKPMRLQMDSTVAYGVQKRTLTTTDTERANDNPYNTYAKDGLPVGPINSPGVDAIKAALAPPAGPWLYFVTVNPSTGETKFSTTLAEHNVFVAQFQAWCQANPGKC